LRYPLAPRRDNTLTAKESLSWREVPQTELINKHVRGRIGPLIGRFNKTRKEQAIYGRIFHSLEDVR
jgi:hypothetical protein